MTNLELIRESERISHEKVYLNSVLFEKGSWLYKPVKTVLEIAIEKYSKEYGISNAIK